MRNQRGFTLIELLVVIAIVASLATVTVLVLNPTELLKQSRDAVRVTDLNIINNAIILLKIQNPNVNLGSMTTVYISLPDDNSSTCGTLAVNLPPIPTLSGWTYSCKTQINYKKVDQSGWIPVDFTSVPTGAPLSVLPADPTNNAIGGFYYTYAVSGDKWELTGVTESQKFADQAARDGGVDPAMLEIGTDLAISPFTHGLAGYWRFDEGSGIVINDSAGFGSNGTVSNSPSWPIGRAGSALDFNGVNQSAAVPNNTNYTNLLNPSNNMSVLFWSKKDVSPPPIDTGLVSKTGGNRVNGFGFSYANSSNDLRFYINRFDGTGSGGYVTANISSPTGSWYHTVGTYDKKNLRLYINGSEVASTPHTVGIGVATIKPVEISRIETGAGTYTYVDATIDEVLMYSRTLSASEIKAIYNATKP